MTIMITSPITERSAVETAATFDQTLRDYEHAVNIAMSRRGTRDAFLVYVARAGAWDRLLAMFPQLKGDSPESQDNLTAVIAAAYWITGDSPTATRIVEGRSDHKMMELLDQLIERKIPGSVWSDRMASIDPETCYDYKK